MPRHDARDVYEQRRADELHLCSRYPQLKPREALAKENLYAVECKREDCACPGWHLERIVEIGSVKTAD